MPQMKYVFVYAVAIREPNQDSLYVIMAMEDLFKKYLGNDKRVKQVYPSSEVTRLSIVSIFLFHNVWITLNLSSSSDMKFSYLVYMSELHQPITIVDVFESCAVTCTAICIIDESGVSAQIALKDVLMQKWQTTGKRQNKSKNRIITNISKEDCR